MRARSEAPRPALHPCAAVFGMTITWLVFVAAFVLVTYLLALRAISGFEAGTALGLLGASTGIAWALIGGYAYYVERVTRAGG